MGELFQFVIRRAQTTSWHRTASRKTSSIGNDSFESAAESSVLAFFDVIRPESVSEVGCMADVYWGCASSNTVLGECRVGYAARCGRRLSSDRGMIVHHMFCR